MTKECLLGQTGSESAGREKSVDARFQAQSCFPSFQCARSASSSNPLPGNSASQPAHPIVSGLVLSGAPVCLNTSAQHIGFLFCFRESGLTEGKEAKHGCYSDSALTQECASHSKITKYLLHSSVPSFTVFASLCGHPGMDTDQEMVQRRQLNKCLLHLPRVKTSFPGCPLLPQHHRGPLQPGPALCLQKPWAPLSVPHIWSKPHTSSGLSNFFFWVRENSNTPKAQRN